MKTNLKTLAAVLSTASTAGLANAQDGNRLQATFAGDINLLIGQGPVYDFDYYNPPLNQPPTPWKLIMTFNDVSGLDNVPDFDERPDLYAYGNLDVDWRLEIGAEGTDVYQIYEGENFGRVDVFNSNTPNKWAASATLLDTNNVNLNGIDRFAVMEQFTVSFTGEDPNNTFITSGEIIPNLINIANDFNDQDGLDEDIETEIDITFNRLGPVSRYEGTLDIVEVGAPTPEEPESCNVADIAVPYGVLDLNDIVAFIEEFQQGCPPEEAPALNHN